ncbi:MAG: lactonase family protein, partial [Puniceicoccaceae bacterium]
MAFSSTFEIYLGTYTRGSGPEASRGIYHLRLDAETGRLSTPQLVAEAENPAFLALHPSGAFLYAVNETGEFEGEKGGGVSAFTRDPATGALAPLNRRPAGGAWTCHLAVDSAGRLLVVANYGGGNVAVFPLGSDGRLASRTQLLQHEGAGPNPRRQEAPHAHGVTFSPDERFLLVPDLGIDRIVVYSVSDDAPSLLPHLPPGAATAHGAGPRHVVFSPDGRHAYAVNELDNTVTGYAWDAPSGTLTPLGSAGTLPADFTGENTTAEIAVHPSGRFVYASNRGDNSIAVFERNPDDGTLTPAGHASTGGREPRSFALSPDGHWLLAANQHRNELRLFRIDPATGALPPPRPPPPPPPPPP